LLDIKRPSENCFSDGLFVAGFEDRAAKVLSYWLWFCRLPPAALYRFVGCFTVFLLETVRRGGNIGDRGNPLWPNVGG